MQESLLYGAVGPSDSFLKYRRGCNGNINSRGRFPVRFFFYMGEHITAGKGTAYHGSHGIAATVFASLNQKQLCKRGQKQLLRTNNEVE